MKKSKYSKSGRIDWFGGLVYSAMHRETTYKNDFTFSKRELSSPFAIYEVYYKNTFLNYIWEPKNFKGPKGERFMVPKYFDDPDSFGGASPSFMNDALDLDNIDISIDAPYSDNKSWRWYQSLDDAAKYFFEQRFTHQL